MGNEGIYSVGKEFGKTLFSFCQTKSFSGTLQDGLSHEILTNLTAWNDSLASSYVLHMWSFTSYSSRELLGS